MYWDGKSWRLAGLAVGCIGLVVLLSWPDQRRSQTVVVNDVLEALWRPQPSRIAAALAAGFDPNQSLDKLDTRPLHILFGGEACRSDIRPTHPATLAVLSLLLQAGADVNAADRRGNTPLMLAVAQCDTRVIADLVGAGADLDAMNQRGLTAFEMALAPARDAGEALLQAGFRLTAEKIAYYRALYHDEPGTLALLHAAPHDDIATPR